VINWPNWNNPFEIKEHAVIIWDEIVRSHDETQLQGMSTYLVLLRLVTPLSNNNSRDNWAFDTGLLMWSLILWIRSSHWQPFQWLSYMQPVNIWMEQFRNKQVIEALWSSVNAVDARAQFNNGFMRSVWQGISIDRSVGTHYSLSSADQSDMTDHFILVWCFSTLTVFFME
jgi:hypothetical protein